MDFFKRIHWIFWSCLQALRTWYFSSKIAISLIFLSDAFGANEEPLIGLPKIPKSWKITSDRAFYHHADLQGWQKHQLSFLRHVFPLLNQLNSLENIETLLGLMCVSKIYLKNSPLLFPHGNTISRLLWNISNWKRHKVCVGVWMLEMFHRSLLIVFPCGNNSGLFLRQWAVFYTQKKRHTYPCKHVNIGTDTHVQMHRHAHPNTNIHFMMFPTGNVSQKPTDCVSMWK